MACFSHVKSKARSTAKELLLFKWQKQNKLHLSLETKEPNIATTHPQVIYDYPLPYQHSL